MALVWLGEGGGGRGQVPLLHSLVDAHDITVSSSCCRIVGDSSERWNAATSYQPTRWSSDDEPRLAKPPKQIAVFGTAIMCLGVRREPLRATDFTGAEGVERLAWSSEN